MRLNLAIARSGVCSRRQADIHIQNKEIYINNKLCVDFNYQMQAGDILTFNRQVLNWNSEEFTYLLMNKPTNCLCTNKDTHGRKIFLDWIKEKDKKHLHLFSVGRLDLNTTGALLITNDGNLVNFLIHPKHHVSKEYVAISKKVLSENELTKYRSGIILKNGEKTQPCDIKLIRTIYDELSKRIFGEYKIVLKEGKKNQIHLSFKCFNTSLLYLTRTKFAFLTCKNLKEGEYRPLTSLEVKELKKFIL